jgi:diaminopimelate decarboxylase
VLALRVVGECRGAVGEGVLSAEVAGFDRVNGLLRCEGVPLDAIADVVGTPTYVYSANAIRARYRRLDAALGDVPHRIH